MLGVVTSQPPVQVAVLFCEPAGVYAGRGLDLWDERRDARTYPGPGPVVCHPPCKRWSLLSSIHGNCGQDDGCFESALRSVREFGGVLEHPAYSYAWKHFGLALPRRGQWLFDGRAWVTEVSQVAYGHVARKLTWLYYVGNVPPFPLDWNLYPAQTTVERMASSGARDVTPLAFSKVLVALATLSAGGPAAALSAGSCNSDDCVL